MFAAALIKRKKHQLAGAPKYGMRPVPVRVITSRLGSLATKIDYLAVFEPVQTANVSARLTTVVDKLLCDEGDTVKAGDTLIELDGREIKNDIATVRADIAQAQSELLANKATVTSLKNSAAYLPALTELVKPDNRTTMMMSVFCIILISRIVQHFYHEPSFQHESLKDQATL